ncbi:Long-chain-fatty-acid--CoA ligase [hydrothermal vent metagenome]|uniref:Long-chain-fatty-acid--CoA ligase n=1 Tax=hydrothermal vent metagenome TaxID=652676 RepID=A0A3B0WXN4_9ZZZZ
MSHPWYTSYPQGIPEDADVSAYSSLVEMFEISCASYKNHPCLQNYGKTISYQQLDDYSQRLASFLQNQLHMKKGDRVAIMMPNLLQNPISIFATLRAGLTVVNINPLYTGAELKHQLCDSGATTIIILENFAHTLQSVIEQTPIKQVILSRMGDMLSFPESAVMNLVVKHVKKMVPPFQLPSSFSFKHCLNKGDRNKYLKPALNRDDFAFLQYTGGTTGVAKGAILTHGNMVANVQQASEWIGPFIEKGKEHIITALPLYHIFSLLANCLFIMKIGGLNHLITNPRDMKGFVKELKNSKFTAITGVNTLFNGLLNTPGFSDVDFSKYKLTLGGGMAVQRSVAERWQKVTGQTLVEAYGLTETSPAICINPMNLSGYNGKIGLPIPSTHVCIKDDDNQILPPGENGEICAKGPQVTQGYYNMAEETALVFDKDGWFHSGDIGFMDEQGYFQIVDRKKDMIIVSGFNVYPNEVEQVIASHADVLEVGVIGMPDEKCGESVMAVIVSKNPPLTAEDIRTHCEQSLTRYKIPKRVEFVKEVPKTNVGKILRRELRNMFSGPE